MKIATALFLITLFLAAGCVTSSRGDKNIVRVMTYNIHHGEGLDKKVDVRRIAALITREKVDVVALQEVDRGVERTARRDFPAELAKHTGMKIYFARNIFYQGGEYGNAVLTRFPIKSRTNTHYRMLRTNEQRGVIQVVLDVHDKDLLFMNTHVDYRPDDAERLINAGELEKIVAGAGKMPVILCGDFNDSPGSPTHDKIKNFLSDTWELVGQGDGFTIPVENPNNRIDYIWISPETVEPLKIRVLESIASDHLPVIGEFRLR